MAYHTLCRIPLQKQTLASGINNIFFSQRRRARREVIVFLSELCVSARAIILLYFQEPLINYCCVVLSEAEGSIIATLSNSCVV